MANCSRAGEKGMWQPRPIWSACRKALPHSAGICQPCTSHQKCLYSTAEKIKDFLFFFFLLNKTHKPKTMNSPNPNSASTEQTNHNLFHQLRERRVDLSCDEVPRQPGSHVLLLHCSAPPWLMEQKIGVPAVWVALLCSPWLPGSSLSL